MADIIKHHGIVESTNNTSVKVKILQTSGCSACSIKGHCSASESKEKIIDIYNIDSSLYNVGDEVWVYGSTSMGLTAVLLAFFVPFIIVVIALFLLIKLVGMSEPQAALVSLLTIIVYYAVIYLFRGKLEKKFTFSIEHINK